MTPGPPDGHTGHTEHTEPRADDAADLRRSTVIRRARTADVRGIRIVAPLAERRVLSARRR